MIIIIRNDKFARFAHEVHGIKIKEEKPLYKIVATLENEGLCIYESPDFSEIARTFDLITDAIIEEKRHIVLVPPCAEKTMTREEFESSDIHDFCRYKEEDHPMDKDIYGRPLPKPCPSTVEYRNEHKYSQQDEQFYNWQINSRYEDVNNRYFDNPPYVDTHTIL